MTYALTRDHVASPFDGLNQMLDWMGFRSREGGTALVPAMDVAETDDSLKISLELPGMSKDELDVTLENGVLTVSGEKTLERRTSEERYHALERRAGSFRRSVTLPVDVDAEKADAKFDDGVLTIEIPKSERIKPKRLSVN